MATVNKRQEEIRRRINEALDEVLNTLVEDLKSMEPSQRVKMALQLSEYVLPKIRPEVNDNAYYEEINEGW